MAARPNITIQVIPFSAGAHIGLQGAFIIAEFADTPPVAFLATATDGQTIEDAAAVARALSRSITSGPKPCPAKLPGNRSNNWRRNDRHDPARLA